MPILPGRGFFDMALFFNKSLHRDNRIENAGQWPVRLTNFYLVDDYEYPPSQYSEIFFVREGNFLHETDHGTQALRQGAIMVNHPSNRHTIKQPENLIITRLRFLPEWFSRDFETILEAPDVLSLFFAQSWFQTPSDTTLHVFNAREDFLSLIEAEIETLDRILNDGRHLEPITRVCLLKLMMLLGDEYQFYWRGGNRIELQREVRRALTFIEKNVTQEDDDILKDIESAAGVAMDKLGKDFRKATGIPLEDYAVRRRVHHSALRLLVSDDTPKDISERFAFADPAELSESFQKYLGISPDVYRQKFGEPPGNGGG